MEIYGNVPIYDMEILWKCPMEIIWKYMEIYAYLMIFASIFFKNRSMVLVDLVLWVPWVREFLDHRFFNFQPMDPTLWKGRPLKVKSHRDLGIFSVFFHIWVN